MQFVFTAATIFFALGAGTWIPQSDGFVAVFNGRNLDSWTILNVAASTAAAPAADKTFTVQNGVLRVEGSRGWLRSNEQYTDFHLRAEFRFLTDNADSGIFVRAVGDSIFLRGWPGNSYQVQARDITRNQSANPILIGNIYRHGNPQGENNFDSQAAFKAAKPTGEWQVLDIEVRDDRLRVVLNGMEVTHATGIADRQGHIGIQGEAGIVEYRSIQIKPIETP